MLNRVQFADQIIVPSLQRIGLYSKAAEELVLGTALVESHLQWLVQLGSGPALGLFQIEPATLRDLYKNFLSAHELIDTKLCKMELLDIPREQQLVFNLWYASAICRLIYYRHRAPLPVAGDIEAQAVYWKKYYNTEAGKGSPQNYISAWNRQDRVLA